MKEENVERDRAKVTNSSRRAPPQRNDIHYMENIVEIILRMEERWSRRTEKEGRAKMKREYLGEGEQIAEGIRLPVRRELVRI